jgi:hypothetical protein
MPDEIEELSGPHLQAAFLCEKVLVERDGIASFIRVTDRFMRPKKGALPFGTQVMPIQVMLVVIFKAGGLPTGTYKVRIRVNRPDPNAPPLMQIDHEVFSESGPDRGFAVITPLFMNLDDEGLYWIDVSFVDQKVTRIPFRVVLVSPPPPPVVGRTAPQHGE